MDEPTQPKIGPPTGRELPPRSEPDDYESDQRPGSPRTPYAGNGYADQAADTDDGLDAPGDVSGYGQLDLDAPEADQGYRTSPRLDPYAGGRVPPTDSGGPKYPVDPGIAAVRGLMKIGLWGSPASGKTTYLAALRHAISRSANAQRKHEYGRWNIFPENRDSARLMANLTDELLRGEFPAPTAPSALPIPLQWVLVGDLAGSRFGSRRLLRRSPEENRFVLDLIDVSGAAFDHDPAKAGSSQTVTDRALDHLTDSNGLIYLFDPVGERDNRDSSRYVNSTITELKRRAADGRRPALNLNQQLSICITKFDDPGVFQAARRHGFVNYGNDGMPQVLERDAAAFFDLLCSDSLWRERYEAGAASAQFVRDELISVFGAANIKYFVTSSIGFYLADGKTFNPENFTNSRRLPGDRRGIKGAINPINVLEPLISLHQRIKRR